MRTIGASNKLTAAVTAIGGPGVLLLILGVLLKSAELRAVGAALLTGGGLAASTGYQVPPDDVEFDHELNIPGGSGEI